jgi:RND family efflux transporter MFP subunit
MMRPRRLIILGLVFALSACSRDAAPSASASAAPGDGSDSAPTVAVVKATRQDLSKGVDLTAEFEPWQNVEIHAKVTGYVKEMKVDVGDHARAGDVLATLEVPELQDELKEADAAIESAQAQEKSAEAEVNETSQLADRLSAAAKESQGLIAQQEIDTANDKNAASQADLAAAKQKVAEAQANADHLRDMLAYTTITAPFDGVVTRRYADVGALVQAGTGGSAGSAPLVSFAQLDQLRLEFPVPESNVDAVRVGDPVVISIASSGEKLKGTIARFAHSVDTSTRTMLTEVDVPNPEDKYTPGMYATVELILSQKKDVLAVPIQAVTTGDKPTVMVVRDNKLESCDVTVGLETADLAEITSGLEEGDLIVVGNHSSLQAGQTVHPQVTTGSNS